MASADIDQYLPTIPSYHGSRRGTLINNPNTGDPIISMFYEKYEMKEILGKGGCSTVRRCIEKSSRTEFACKVIDLTIAENAELRVQIMSETKGEIEILQMCAGHQNILSLHDSYESNTFIFIILELCKAGELFDFLTQHATLSEKRTRFLMGQLLNAVVFLHSRHIAHRDIKTENILLDDQQNIKLSDFGFAIFCEDDVSLTELVGTPIYLAPEVLKVAMAMETEGYGRPADVWGCGVVMFMLLCGAPPFYESKQMRMFHLIIEGKIEFTQPEWMDVSDICKDLITKLLVVDPKKRLTAAEALAHPFMGHHVSIIPLPPKPAVHPTFKIVAYVVLYTCILRAAMLRPSATLSLQHLQSNPYAMRMLRKLIDNGAFQIYGHWIKKTATHQGRTLMFANEPKRDLKNRAAPPLGLIPQAVSV